MKFTISLLAMALSLATHAGQGGNGGGAFVCRNSAGKILSSQLVDLYEAEAQYGLTVKRDSRLTVDEQLDLAAFRIQSSSNDFYLKLDSHINEVRQILRIVPNAKLENTQDFDIVVSPKTCNGGKVGFEQLANYTDEGQLIVDEEIWKTLPATDKAALYLHEAIYSYLRKEDMVITSKRARQITGYSFSNPSKSDFKLLLDTVILSGHYLCDGTLNEFEITAELPSFGDKLPVYLVRANLCATGMFGLCGVTWFHELKMKEMSTNQYQGTVTAVVKKYTEMKNLNGGTGAARRLSNGTLTLEMSWAGPQPYADGSFYKPQIEQSLESPRWWYMNKFTGCKRTGPAQI
jgi:hypothetical protein